MADRVTVVGGEAISRAGRHQDHNSGHQYAKRLLGQNVGTKRGPPSDEATGSLDGTLPEPAQNRSWNTATDLTVARTACTIQHNDTRPLRGERSRPRRTTNGHEDDACGRHGRQCPPGPSRREAGDTSNDSGRPGRQRRHDNRRRCQTRDELEADRQGIKTIGRRHYDDRSLGSLSRLEAQRPRFGQGRHDGHHRLAGSRNDVRPEMHNTTTSGLHPPKLVLARTARCVVHPPPHRQGNGLGGRQPTTPTATLLERSDRPHTCLYSLPHPGQRQQATSSREESATPEFPSPHVQSLATHNDSPSKFEDLASLKISPRVLFGVPQSRGGRTSKDGVKAAWPVCRSGLGFQKSSGETHRVEFSWTCQEHATR